MSHYGIGMQTSLQPSYAQEESPRSFQNKMPRLSILPNASVSQTERSVRTRLLQIGQQITNCRENGLPTFTVTEAGEISLLCGA